MNYKLWKRKVFYRLHDKKPEERTARSNEWGKVPLEEYLMHSDHGNLAIRMKRFPDEITGMSIDIVPGDLSGGFKEKMTNCLNILGELGAKVQSAGLDMDEILMELQGNADAYCANLELFCMYRGVRERNCFITTSMCEKLYLAAKYDIEKICRRLDRFGRTLRELATVHLLGTETHSELGNGLDKYIAILKAEGGGKEE